MSGPLGDEEAQRRRSARELGRAQRDANALRAVLSTPDGRRFFWRLVDVVAGTFGPSYSDDAFHTAYAEGRRSVGLSLVGEAQRVCPDLYVLALQDALEESRSDRAAQESGADEGDE